MDFTLIDVHADTQHRRRSEMEDIGSILQTILSPEWVSRMSRRHALEDEWIKIRHDQSKRWPFLRKLYKEYESDLAQAALQHPRYSTDPYFVDWLPIFTPIEDMAWCAIRYRGLPFYPQYPALQFFLDFACPHKKIAVETDGKMHDRERDIWRDGRLVEAGWKVFHVPGRECFQDFKTKYEMFCEDMPEDDQEAETERWLTGTIDGIFESIRIVYFSDGDSPHYGSALRSLVRHRLVDFPI